MPAKRKTVNLSHEQHLSIRIPSPCPIPFLLIYCRFAINYIRKATIHLSRKLFAFKKFFRCLNQSFKIDAFLWLWMLSVQLSFHALERIWYQCVKTCLILTHQKVLSEFYGILVFSKWYFSQVFILKYKSPEWMHLILNHDNSMNKTTWKISFCHKTF